jgi:hypothetical protein
MKFRLFLTGAAVLLALPAAGCMRQKTVAPTASAPAQEQIQTVTIDENDLRQRALVPLQIIWPQVLDGPTTGQASYHLSMDSSGSVTDVQPLTIAVERSNDSVIRQIMRLKFKPLVKDGASVPAEGVLTFHFNTRGYGPAAPLTEAEVRRLATGIVDPDYPPGTASGTACSFRIAVDSDGYLIEVIFDDCPAKFSLPSLVAIRKWHFSPILEEGQPRPYRAEVTFRAP